MTKPLALYSLAHSNPNGTPGATTDFGTCERFVSRSALVPFQSVLEGEGFEVKAFKGRLRPKMRLMKKAIKKARRAEQPWVSVALHFNQSPKLNCPFCGKKIRAGLECPHCMGRGIPWKFGHTVMLYKNSRASRSLADRIMTNLTVLMPWSTRKDLILLPDPRYSAIWPTTVPAPAVLVELGFACDPVFAKWISDPLSHTAYGLAIGESVADWFKARKDKIDFDHWDN